MSILQSIVLGIIQGITEFFPVSSSGHLVIFPYFFNWDYMPLYFTVTVHFATLAAVVTAFYREIYRIIKAVVLGIFKRKIRNSDDFRVGIFLIIASIPAALAGFFLDDWVEDLFTRPLIVAVFLLVTAFLLWMGELRGARVEKKKGPVEKDTKESGRLLGTISLTGQSKGRVRLNLFISAMAGIGQAPAILPGSSRSGATLSFARFFRIKRSDAVKFSFLLSLSYVFVFKL